VNVENKNDKGSPSVPNVFFDDLEMYAPRDIKKLGYQLKKGMSYRLYSGAEIRDRIKDGTIVPLKARPTKAKKAVEEVVAPRAIPAPAPAPSLTDEERKASLERNDRANAPREIEHAIRRWYVTAEPILKPREKKWVIKESPLTKEDKERIRWLFQKFAFTVEWNEEFNNINVVVHDKVHTIPVPPRVPTAIQRKINEARARLIKK
jgi:hypothetical protein